MGRNGATEDMALPFSLKPSMEYLACGYGVYIAMVRTRSRVPRRKPPSQKKKSFLNHQHLEYYYACSVYGRHDSTSGRRIINGVVITIKGGSAGRGWVGQDVQ